MEKRKRGTLSNGQAKAAVLLVAVSCSTSSPTERGGRNIDFRSEPPPSIEDTLGGIAHAATDASVADAGVAMPKNASHVALRFPRVPKVQLETLGGKECPYPHKVEEDDDETILILYLPQGIQVGIRARAVMQVGLDADDNPIYEPIYEEVGKDEKGEPIYEPIEATATVESNTKAGTNKLTFGGSHTNFKFTPGAQQTLTLGENYLQGPVTSERMDGETRELMHGVFVAPADMECEVAWAGCQAVISFHDGPPVRHTEPFLLQLREGDDPGIFPIVNSDVEAVQLRLRDTSILEE